MAMEPVIAGGIGWHKAVVDIPADAHVLDLVFRDSSDMHVSGGCACTPHRRFDGLTGRFGEGCRVPAEAQHAQQPVAQSRLACAALRCQPMRGASVSQTDLIPPVLSVCLSSPAGGVHRQQQGHGLPRASGRGHGHHALPARRARRLGDGSHRQGEWAVLCVNWRIFVCVCLRLCRLWGGGRAAACCSALGGMQLPTWSAADSLELLPACPALLPPLSCDDISA